VDGKTRQIYFLDYNALATLLECSSFYGYDHFVMPTFLLIKTSSLGDVLHNLPVVSDIRRAFPEAKIDWVVEENFADLPALHPAVRNVYPVAVRRWRKNWWRARAEIITACRSFQNQRYDLVLDTQGLVKSALLTRLAHGIRAGFAWDSAREPLSSLFYNQTYSVTKTLHAVERNRRLAAAALGYQLQAPADYGIRTPALNLPWLNTNQYVVLLHATSRDDKLWYETNWLSLGAHLRQAGLQAILPWGSAAEKSRAERLCAGIPDSLVAPRLNLNEAATLLGKACAVVGVDTGLSHLAAALNVPTVGIYIATNPGLTGLYAGDCAINLGGKNDPPSVEQVIEKLTQFGIYA